MGGGLPKPVTSRVVKRFGGSLFHGGFAEMNGHRKNMEDAHVIFMRDTWGFFGVFDGHGGDQCSTFIAKRLNEELEKGPPVDDAAMKELVLRLDREFLATDMPSGSCGTFVLVTPPASSESRYSIRVGNIGDSRVLLGRRDGTMVEGSGTDGGLTTDHKPDHPDEKVRIDRTGGHVELIQGVARVNGDLAISRAFGDAQHKKTGGPSQEDHPVSAVPELTRFDCDGSDFLVVVCDGISEGAFPNREVVQFAAQELFKKGEGLKPDAGMAAAAVCSQALAAGSQDNLSCMIVLLGGEPPNGPELELLPGPFDAPCHAGFRTAYEAMAEHAGITLVDSIEMRYDEATKELTAHTDGTCKPALTAAEADDLRAEIAAYGEGPPSSLTRGSAERKAWFTEWLNGHDLKDDDGLWQPIRPRMMRVCDIENLRSAVDECPMIVWNEEMTKVADHKGSVLLDDHEQGTSKVVFFDLGMECWLPTHILTDLPGRKVRVSVSAEELRAAVEKCSAINWVDQFKDVCSSNGEPAPAGEVIVDDPTDCTSQVKFVGTGLNFTAWLPTSTLNDIDQVDAGEGADGDEPEAKRQRVEE